MRAVSAYWAATNSAPTGPRGGSDTSSSNTTGLRPLIAFIAARTFAVASRWCSTSEESRSASPHPAMRFTSETLTCRYFGYLPAAREGSAPLSTTSLHGSPQQVLQLR